MGVQKTGVKETSKQFRNSTILNMTGMAMLIYDFNTDPAYVATPPTGKKTCFNNRFFNSAYCRNRAGKNDCKKLRQTRGTVIVLNPKNGEVLSICCFTKL